MWSHYAHNHKGICLEFDILEDPELQNDEPINEDKSQLIQRLYDKHKGLFDILDTASPEEVEEINRFADFLKSKR